MQRRRKERLDSRIGKLAADFIAREADSSASIITVTDTVLEPERNTATVKVTVYPDTAADAALAFLERRSDDFRALLADNLATKYLPRVYFAIDAGEKNRHRIDELSRGDAAHE